MSGRFRLRFRFGYSPIFYLFLLCIVAAEYIADQFYYSYENWWMQGTFMLLVVMITLGIFGCESLRNSRRERQLADVRAATEEEQNLMVSVTRDGVMSQVPAHELTVGDKFSLSAGDSIPCDCVIIEVPDGTFQVNESAFSGERKAVGKQSVCSYSSRRPVLDGSSLCFANSIVEAGHARVIALAVGEASTAAIRVQENDNLEDKEADKDLADKHANIMQILICVLIMVCTLVLVQCAISIDISWEESAQIATMMFVYGFPYLLAIPAIWDVAQRNSAKNFDRYGNIEVQNLEAIEDVASLNYLAVQTISVLDDRSSEKLEEYRRTIRGLQAAGVKVVLAAGIPEENARKIALEVGILKADHANICGAVISGQELRKIINGQETGIRFDITPEYLSVVYKASAEERAMLVDYLAKVHPGRVSANSPSGFGSETFRTAPPVATVGVVGSGQNDLQMMSKAKISFSTYNQCDEVARNAADMVLKSDNISDVVNAVVRGRAFKDRLMQILLLQLPSSLT